MTAARRPRRLAAVAVVASLLVVPATASAERWVSYRVTVEGEGTYSYDHSSADGSRHHRAQWTWRTQFPVVTFQGDRPLTQSPDNAGAVTTAKLLSAESTRVTAGDVYRCAPTEISWAGTGRFLEDDAIPTPEPTIGLRVLGGILPDFDGCPHQAATQFDLLGVTADGLHTFDTWFSVPREAIGMGRIIQLVHEEVTGRRCPNNLSGDAGCRLTFDAAVTFDKTKEFELPDGPPPDITPEDIPTPPPAPAPPPVAPDAAMVRVAGAGLPASAAKVALAVSCPGDCSGTVTATLPRRRAAAAAAARVLARRRFTARAGRSRRVVIRFSRAARRRIRRAGGVSLRVRTVTAGQVHTRVLSLTLSGGAKGGPRPRSRRD